ncbi:unnamed protein product, partial [Durusdinium trenchii]
MTKLFAALILCWGGAVGAHGWPLKDGNKPASFDCEWRKLAYAYGRKLLPRMGTFESLYYALDLNSDSCHMDMEAVATPASDPQPSDLQPRDWRDTAVFVDVNGDDSQVGSENHPVRSLQVACDLAITRGAEIPMVVLRGGTHFLMKTLMLGPQHSKLLITSYPNEHAEVSGGKKLQVTWRPYNLTGGANIWVSDVPGQVQEVVALHVDGVRATRARYPNMPQGVEVTCGYGCTIDGSKQTWIRPDFTKFGNSSNYTDTTPQHFRNTTVWDWFKRYEIGVGGECSIYDPPVSYWCAQHPQGGGRPGAERPAGLIYKSPNGPYEHGEDARFFVWRPSRWFNWIFDVAKYDPVANNFTFGHGGHQGARGYPQGTAVFFSRKVEDLELLRCRFKKLKDRITPHMNLYESEGFKAQSSQSLNSFYNTALSGSDISFRQQRGGREGVRE